MQSSWVLVVHDLPGLLIMHKQRASNTVDMIDFSSIIFGPFLSRFTDRFPKAGPFSAPTRQQNTFVHAFFYLTNSSNKFIVFSQPFRIFSILYLFFRTLSYLHPVPLSLLKILLSLQK